MTLPKSFAVLAGANLAAQSAEQISLAAVPIVAVLLMQAVTPPTMLGRMSAIFLTVNMSARPLGAALGGVVGEVWGASACLWLALAGFCVQAWVIFDSPVRLLLQLPQIEPGTDTARNPA